MKIELNEQQVDDLRTALDIASRECRSYTDFSGLKGTLATKNLKAFDGLEEYLYEQTKTN